MTLTLQGEILFCSRRYNKPGGQMVSQKRVIKVFYCNEKEIWEFYAYQFWKLINSNLLLFQPVSD